MTLFTLCTASTFTYAGEPQTSLVPINCTSTAGQRQHCAANTSSGILMRQSTGTAACLLGKTWGYDDAGVWVMDGCGADFLVMQTQAPSVPSSGMAVTLDKQSQESEPAVAQGTNIYTNVGTRSETQVKTADSTSAEKKPSDETTTADAAVHEPNETWGTFDPGKGFVVGKTPLGSLAISGYALARYMDQTSDSLTYTDHLGNEHVFKGRKDIYSHRIMVWLNGWLADPRFVYTIAFWTVNTTDQDAIFGNIGYQFNKKFNLYAGINGNPGSRSMQGSHPYWLGTDRVMADEFFRPYFTMGIWAQGEVLPGLWYNTSVGNSNSILGVKSTDLDRRFTYGASMWWMPTTHEFGPRGGYGDWEYHEKLATRFGFSTTFSPEQRYTDPPDASSNTTLKLADSTNLFDTGTLAPGVSVFEADYTILALDAGMKYHGIFLQTELYYRKLDSFNADGALPVDEIIDKGFYVQAAFYPIPKKLELYAVTSQIYGDSDAGFGNSHEYVVGTNWYPFNSRNYRFNLQLMDIYKSPVSSTFGYYTAGQVGTTVSGAFSLFF